MAEPGDPKPPESPAPDVDHDAGIGFSSASSLQGQARTRPEPAPRPEPEPVRERPTPTPAWAIETPVEALPTYAGFGSRRARSAEVEGGMGLYAIYALILFAVPTLGVSALIALFAVTTRARPQGEVAASHFVFQQRTLWIGAVAAVLGGVLIAVGLGVFVLFVLAVWLILRGAAGVLKLKAGRPIPNPRAWLI